MKIAQSPVQPGRRLYVTIGFVLLQILVLTIALPNSINFQAPFQIPSIIFLMGATSGILFLHNSLAKQSDQQEIVWLVGISAFALALLAYEYNSEEKLDSIILKAAVLMSASSFFDRILELCLQVSIATILIPAII